MRYLDPKADLTFKKIFGEHPNLTISLLNALLPIDSPIESITYLTPEQVPQIPGLKNSFVDVRCIDHENRTFIVEMQMFWTSSFKQRVVFNAAKSYVKQLDKGFDYDALQPVYALNLVNDVFDKSEDFYHHYSIVHSQDTKKRLEGLEFVFVELPKFKPANFQEKKMQLLWLRFLTEITDGTENISQDLIDNKSTNQAVEILKESSYSKKELDGYDRYWDLVSTQRSIEGDRRRDAEKYALMIEETKLLSEKVKESEEKVKESEEKVKESQEKVKESQKKVKESQEKVKESQEKVKEYEEKVMIAKEKANQAEEKGIEKGIIQEKIEGIKKSIKRGKLTLDEIAEDFQVSIEFVKNINKKLE